MELVAYFSPTGTTKRKAEELATSGGSGFGDTLTYIKKSLPDTCKLSLGKVNDIKGI